MPSAEAAPAPAAALTAKPRRIPSSTMRTAIAPTGIAIAYPARAPASSSSIGRGPSGVERRTGDDCGEDRNRDAGERAEEVVLGEVAIVELLEAGDRLGADDEPDGGVRADEHERNDEKSFDDADRRPDLGGRRQGDALAGDDRRHVRGRRGTRVELLRDPAGERPDAERPPSTAPGGRCRAEADRGAVPVDARSLAGHGRRS